LKSLYYTNLAFDVNQRKGAAAAGTAESTAPTARISIDKSDQGADNIGNMKGLSSEIARLGLALLVQTQEMGGRSCYIETLVYHNGRLVHSRKTPYTRSFQDPSWEDRLAALIGDEHREILRELAAGRLDHLLPKAGT
jgi:hypothetical protein